MSLATSNHVNGKSITAATAVESLGGSLVTEIDIPFHHQLR